MKPYSTDFRRKIVETKQKTQESNQQIAERFQVSYSFVSRLVKRYESTGSVEPSPHGGGKALKLNSKQIDMALQYLLCQNPIWKISKPYWTRIFIK